MKYYSATTAGFYPPEFQADYEAAGTWPADAIEITDDLYKTLMMALQVGKVILIGVDGIPYAADRPLDPNEVIKNKNILINSQIDTIERQNIMNRGCREGWIAIILQEAKNLGKDEEFLLDSVTGNPFYIKLKQVDEQICQLRSQLK